MKALVEVTETIEVECDDAVVDELMTSGWQSVFYTFDTRDEAIAWLAWVVERWHGTEHVDGLVGIGSVTTHKTAQGMEVVR